MIGTITVIFTNYSADRGNSFCIFTSIYGLGSCSKKGLILKIGKSTKRKSLRETNHTHTFINTTFGSVKFRDFTNTYSKFFLVFKPVLPEYI